MSRHGHRVRNKTRHRSFELESNKTTMISRRSCQKRRQTEPAVCDAAAKVMIIEEDEDAAPEDYTDSMGYTTYHESSRRPSDLPLSPMLTIDENHETIIPPVNGDCKMCPNDDTCSIKVICDTLEADL
ncbi:unnamed protein product [Strongylus vulgaris]|uniref:Uncharacterized protein n=1 Tax=Strongylus vulgaris TaxID=40348 RepID=A0A3P7IWV3_STRVU|nr:unnamed protein product [Strongylus vulgaris]